MLRPHAVSRLLGVTALVAVLPGPVHGQVPEEEWTVDLEPVMEVGGLEGPDEALFVYVVDAARLPDGGLVVADYGAGELRFFDSAGDLVRVGGREGEGPGEFRGLLGVEVLPGDSVTAWDYSRGVLSYWSLKGDHLTERPARYATSHEGELLPDGSVIVPRYHDEPTPSSGRYRPSAVLVRHTFEGSQELGPFPYDEMLGGARVGVSMPYHSRSVVAAGGRPFRIVVADDTNLPLARQYDAGGSPSGELRLFDGREPVSRAHWENLLDGLREAGVENPALERHFVDWGRPETTPAFDDLVVDTEGRVWTIRTEAEDHWAVVHVDGRPLARVRLPTLDAIYQIGSDYIVGLRTDPLGVQSVRVYGFDAR